VSSGFAICAAFLVLFCDYFSIVAFLTKSMRG
jgi:hypothetical protein